MLVIAAGILGPDSMTDRDARASIYRNLHADLKRQEAANLRSAEIVLSRLWSYVRPRSILDVGCGLGSWLAAARERGVQDLAGIEGPWFEPPGGTATTAVVRCDLEQGFALRRRFDLAICLEVVEHLSPAGGARLLDSIVQHADIVMFSAAVPHQGGRHHVNEQPLDHWAEEFRRRGLSVHDFLRADIWDDRDVLAWLRQNVVVFARRETLGMPPWIRRPPANRGPMSVIHPELYTARMTELDRILRLQRRLIERYERLLGIDQSMPKER
jgi:SAM-dependent methyltransferase